MSEISPYDWLLVVLILMGVALLKFISKLLKPLLAIFRDSKGQLNPEADLKTMDLMPTHILTKLNRRRFKRVVNHKD